MSFWREKVGEGVVGGAEQALQRVALALAERLRLGLALFLRGSSAMKRRRHADQHQGRHGGIAIVPHHRGRCR